MSEVSHKCCSVLNCGRKVKARGLCPSHYARAFRGVTVEVPLRQKDMNPPPICTIEGCANPTKANGLCATHYMRKLRHGHTKEIARTRPWKQCTVENCGNQFYAKGMCHQHYIRAKGLEKKFGTTLQAIQEMEAAQGSKCAICLQTQMRIGWLSGKPDAMAVDHDHKTGKIRGLLCDTCNRAIGMLKDNPDIMRAAASYIERHRQPS